MLQSAAKDSMSGTFEHIDVPPTLVSFAVTTDSIKNIISPEFKGEGHKVILLKPEYDKRRSAYNREPEKAV